METQPRGQLIIIRGLPGSGKSTLAKELRAKNPTLLSFVTDDFFMRPKEEHGEELIYDFDLSRIREAHGWNEQRFKEAILRGHSPLVVENTQCMFWECKFYVQLAVECGYKVTFMEPSTPWWLQRDVEELERRNQHGVSRETIEHMLGRWQDDITVEKVLNSERPIHKGNQSSLVSGSHSRSFGFQKHERWSHRGTRPRKDQCRHFFQGNCRYGNDCRFSHQ